MNVKKFPKDIAKKIFYFWLDINKFEIHREFIKKLSFISSKISYINYYKYPEHEIYHTYRNLSLKITIYDINLELVRLMRYFIDNKYRLDKVTKQTYYIKLIKKGRILCNPLFYNYYRFEQK